MPNHDLARWEQERDDRQEAAMHCHVRSLPIRAECVDAELRIAIPSEHPLRRAVVDHFASALRCVGLSHDAVALTDAASQLGN